MTQWQSHHLAPTVSGSIPGKVGILTKTFFPGTWKDSVAKPQSLVSVSKILALNPKSLHSAYDVKVYRVQCWQRFVRRMGTLSHEAALVLFEKIRLRSATNFPFSENSYHPDLQNLCYVFCSFQLPARHPWGILNINVLIKYIINFCH